MCTQIYSCLWSTFQKAYSHGLLQNYIKSSIKFHQMGFGIYLHKNVLKLLYQCEKQFFVKKSKFSLLFWKCSIYGTIVKWCQWLYVNFAVCWYNLSYGVLILWCWYKYHFKLVYFKVKPRHVMNGFVVKK